MLFAGGMPVKKAEWYTVGQLAKRTGVNPKTIRYYDRVGLLKPSGATAGGYRLYRAEDVQRLEFILTLRQVGYTLREIRKILDADIHPDMAIDLQLQALTEQIERLTALKEILQLAKLGQWKSDPFQRLEVIVRVMQMPPDSRKEWLADRIKHAVEQSLPNVHWGGEHEENLRHALDTVVPDECSPAQGAALAEAAEWIGAAGGCQKVQEHISHLIDRIQCNRLSDELGWVKRLHSVRQRLRRGALEGVAPDSERVQEIVHEYNQLFAEALGMSESEYLEWQQQLEAELSQIPFSRMPELVAAIRSADGTEPDELAKRLLRDARARQKRQSPMDREEVTDG